MLKCLLIYHLECGICTQIKAKRIALASKHMLNKVTRNTTCVEQKKRTTHFKVYYIEYFTQDYFTYQRKL